MARLLEELTTDFSRGMFEDVAATRYPSNVASLILNGRILPDGTVVRRDGSIRTHASAINVDTGYGGKTFRLANGTVVMVTISGAKAYKSTDSGVTWTEIATGLRQDYYSFAVMRVGATVYLLAANGDTTIKRYDGTTWDTLPNAPSGVKYLAVFNGRLWVTGHSGVLAQGSAVGDPTIWSSPSGVTVQIIVHGGDSLSGMIQVGPHLLVFDRESTSYIDGYGEQTLVVATGATGFSRSVGCIAFRTIVGVGDNAVSWLSTRGVEYYTPGQGIVLISRGVQQFLANIDRVAIDSNPGIASAEYDPITQEIYVALATNRFRNNRILVINLLQRGSNWLGAATIDEPFESGSPSLRFNGAPDGYLQTDANGYLLRADPFGYMQLATGAQGGDTVLGGGDGYLATQTNDTLPASLFIGPSDYRSSAIHMLGYDGFVRRVDGRYDKDDVLSDGSGGNPITMTVRSRPFLFKSPNQRKRCRAIHVASINPTTAALSARVVVGGVLGPERTVNVAGTDFDQPRRVRSMTAAVGDAPQCEIKTTDKARLALVGITAELLREPV